MAAWNLWDNVFVVLNEYNRGISLSLEVTKAKKKIGTTIKIKTYFKPTDRNMFIPIDSCYHMVWLRSVPHGQFWPLRQNCSTTHDLEQQALSLRQRTKEKGYNKSEEDTEIKKAKIKMDTCKWYFFTYFPIQNRQIRNILNKHWDILRNYCILGPTTSRYNRGYSQRRPFTAKTKLPQCN